MIPINRIKDREDVWGVDEYADTLVECVDMRFMEGGIYQDSDLPQQAERMEERKQVIDDARGEVKERITICLVADEVLMARLYLREKIGLAHGQCDEWREEDILEENEMIAFEVCSQNLQCMIFVHDILKDLERGKWQRKY
jgi:hypothetical protein